MATSGGGGHKDFLHKSWFAAFSRDRLDYFAFGNTQATDFFHNLELGENVDVLMLGAGDIRSILKTVSRLETPEHSKQTVKKLRFVVNDIDADILARDLLLLEIIQQCDVDDDYDFLWGVWYNVELPLQHHHRLAMLINRLSDGNFGQNRLWSFFDKDTRKAVQKSFQKWEKSRLTVEQAKSRRMTAIHNKPLGPVMYENGEYRDIAASVMGQDNKVKALLDIFGANVVGTMFRYPEAHDGSKTDASCHVVQAYYQSGSADPHYGVTGQCFPHNRRDWKVNPTLLKAGCTEYLVDVTASPFVSYTPIEKTYFDKHKHIGEACFSLLKDQVRAFRELFTGKKLQLDIELLVGDAASILPSCSLLGQSKFDFIDTSNLSDHMSLLAVLLLCQPHLRGNSSVLRVESLFWKRCHDSIEEYLNDQLLGLDPQFYPTVLGLRLAETFGRGRREPPTMMELFPNDHVRFRETLLWVKASRPKITPISLEGCSDIRQFLLAFARRVFTEPPAASRLIGFSRSRDPMLLMKMLEHLEHRVVGGMPSLMELVKPMVSEQSEFLFQWQVYQAVYGYSEQQDCLVSVKVPILKMKIPMKTSDLSFCVLSVQNGRAQRFCNVLVSNNSLEVLMLKSQWDKMKRTSGISCPDMAGITLDTKPSIVHETAVRGSTDEQHCVQEQQKVSVVEQKDKYTVTVSKEYVVEQRACSMQLEATLTIKPARELAEIKVALSCCVESFTVRSSEEGCQIVIQKKRSDIVGEQILPLCKVLLHKLQPFGANALPFTTSNGLMNRMFPLHSDGATLHVIEDGSQPLDKLEGRQILTRFRHILCCLVTQPWQAVMFADCLLLLKEIHWYNDNLCRKIVFIDNINGKLDKVHRYISPFHAVVELGKDNKTVCALVTELLHQNSLQIEQSDTDPDIIISFLQLHFPRGHILGQMHREHQQSTASPGAGGGINVCANCGTKENLKKCARCRSISYCGRNCQIKDFKKHKTVCKQLASKDGSMAAKPNMCQHCKMQSSVAEHVCSRCKKAEYCSMKCRYADWRKHQDHCQDISEPDEKPHEASHSESTQCAASSVPASESPPDSTAGARSSTAGARSYTASSPPPSPSQCSCCQQTIKASGGVVCSKCQDAVYCSERCEQRHWPQHWEACLHLSLANVATCQACTHTMNRCPRCKKVWFCSGCQESFDKHQC